MTQDAFIDISERFYPDGVVVSYVDAHGALPMGMYYKITMKSGERHVSSKSRAFGNGSIRYYTHPDYDAAIKHGIKWARRKVAEAKRARRMF